MSKPSHPNLASEAKAENEPAIFRTFVVVRSRRTDDPMVRLQSDPLLFGLKMMGGLQVSTYLPNADHRLTIEGATCILFHYNDLPAVQALREMDAGSSRTLIICLGSDIYSYSAYTKLHDLVDFFIMPTELHTQILSSQVYKPVFTLPECIDPIALGGRAPKEILEQPISQTPKSRTRLLWFGFSESFYKGMSSLIPAIKKSLEEGKVDSFGIIVDEKRFRNTFHVQTIPYDETAFLEQVKLFDYAILSHFPLDLSVNSYIKSPNKAITALISGLIPIASNTPSYRTLFIRLGLQRFLFSSPSELYRILSELDPVSDSDFVERSGAIPTLLSEGSQERLVQNFVRILTRYLADDPELRTLPFVPLTLEDSQIHHIGVRDHLSDLLPSIIRYFKLRWTGLKTKNKV